MLRGATKSDSVEFPKRQIQTTKQSANLSQLRFSHRLHPRRNPYLDRFEVLRRLFRTPNQLLHILEDVSVLQLLAKFLNKGKKLAIEHIHLSAETRIKKQFPVDSSAQRQSRRHFPIPAHLTHPVILLRAQSARDLHDLVNAFRPELRQPPVPGFSHLRLAAQVVEFQ